MPPLSNPSGLFMAANHVAATHTSSSGKPISVAPSSTSPTVQSALSMSSCAGTSVRRCEGRTTVTGNASLLSNFQVNPSVTSRGHKSSARDRTIFLCTRREHKIHHYGILRTPGMYVDCKREARYVCRLQARSKRQLDIYMRSRI